MNELEMSVILKRAERPLENWEKITSIASKIPTLPYLHSERQFEVADLVLRRTYTEIWQSPEKIVLLRDKVIDLGIFGNLDDIIDALCTKYEPFKQLDKPTVITPESAISYIALREFGFRVRAAVSISTYRRIARTHLVFKYLDPAKLLPILNSNRSRVEKLITLNEMLRAVELPTLAGTPRDNLGLRRVKVLSECLEKLTRLSKAVNKFETPSGKRRHDAEIASLKRLKQWAGKGTNHRSQPMT